MMRWLNIFIRTGLQAVVCCLLLSPVFANEWTEGTKQILILRADFPDQVGAPATQQELELVMTNSVHPWYEECSYGKTTLETTVSPLVYRLPTTSTNYLNSNDYYGVYDDAVAAATSEYDVVNYDRVMIFFPNTFSWAGLASIGDKELWIDGNDSSSLIIHELGHTYGLQHATRWQVGDGNPVSPTGTVVTYGDVYDVMGAGGDAHFNPKYKLQLDWIPESSITTVATSGTFRTYRFDHENADITNNCMALRLPRGDGREFWISFRQKNLISRPALSNGAYIVWSYDDEDYTQLLDITTPGVNYYDAPLAVGASFTDTVARISINPIAIGGTTPNEWIDVNCQVYPIVEDMFVTMDGSDAASGTNWVEAKQTIQSAIDAASAGLGYDTTIWVSNGVYNTGGKAIYGTMTNRVAIDKPMVVQSVGPGVTMIQGQGPPGDSAVRCVYMTNRASLFGFTVSNGYTKISGNAWNERAGGGIWCAGDNVVVSNCVITGNDATYYGGGAHNGTFYNSMFTSNTATNYGGGVYLGTLYDCTVADNSVRDFGGGISESVSYRCTITSNSAYWYGGGVYRGSIYNCVLSGNDAYRGGGAYRSDLYNCTVVSNDASSEGGGDFEGTVYNSIIYYNTAPAGTNSQDGTLIASCATPLFAGSLNITNAPQFMNAATGNYRLLVSSPCVNSGTNQLWMATAQDLDGAARIADLIVDMGAYELIDVTDSDNDGLTDNQETFIYGSNPNNPDTDNDGMNDGDEAYAGTILTNALSVFEITQLSAPVTNVIIYWSSVQGKTYEIWSNTNLLTNVWTIVDGSIPASPPVNAYTVTPSSVYCELYKIVVE